MYCVFVKLLIKNLASCVNLAPMEGAGHRLTKMCDLNAQPAEMPKYGKFSRLFRAMTSKREHK